MEGMVVGRVVRDVDAFALSDGTAVRKVCGVRHGGETLALETWSERYLATNGAINNARTQDQALHLAFTVLNAHSAKSSRNPRTGRRLGTTSFNHIWIRRTSTLPFPP